MSTTRFFRSFIFYFFIDLFFILLQFAHYCLCFIEVWGIPFDVILQDYYSWDNSRCLSFIDKTKCDLFFTRSASSTRLSVAFSYLIIYSGCLLVKNFQCDPACSLIWLTQNGQAWLPFHRWLSDVYLEWYGDIFMVQQIHCDWLILFGFHHYKKRWHHIGQL